MYGRRYTQIVGAPCAHCERRVVSLDDGAACEHCGAVVHVDDVCWQAHWEATHVGASDYRGATRAPPPRAELLPARGSEPRHAPAGTEALLCTACRRSVFAAATSSFLGFKQFTCPACATTVLHPLSGARQTVYLVVGSFAGGVTVLALIQGSMAFVAAAFAVVSASALVTNHKVKQQLERVELSEPTYAASTLPAKTTRKKLKKKAKPAELS